MLKAFLFGSCSREEATNSSDLGILVELDYSQHIGMNFVPMKFELEEKLRKKVDLVPGESVYPYILSFINNDKKLIDEKQDR